MTPLDPDRTIALAYVPVRHRSAVEALWTLDAALGHALAGGREPMIARIKLVWWRDALEALDRDEPPAEPVLQALATHVVSKGIGGADMAAMEEGWSVLTEGNTLSSEDLDRYAAQRGGRLFALTARLLGSETAEVERSGEVWALVDLARHSGEPDAGAALAAARSRAPSGRWPTALRPLGMLAVLAQRDATRGLEPPGSPRRMARVLRHRLTGR